MIQTVGRFIAVEPFPVQHVTGSVKGGLAFVEQKFTLTKLNLVFDVTLSRGDGVLPMVLRAGGDAIYVASDQYVQAWAKKVYESVDGFPFILVPAESVVLVEMQDVRTVNSHSVSRT